MPMAWHGGWKKSLFGDRHAYGEEGVCLYLAGEHSERRRVHDAGFEVSIAPSGCHFEALRADAKHTDAPLDI